MFCLLKKCQPKFCFIRDGFLSAFFTVIYVISIVLLMNKAEKIFGAMNNFFAPLILLLLFVLSALIIGILLLGLPIWHYVEGRGKNALVQLAVNAVSLLIFIVVIIILRIFLW